MKRIFYSVVAGVALAGLTSAPVGGSEKSPVVVGCLSADRQLIDSATPLSPGPLKLEAIYCNHLPPSSYPEAPALVSPDGTRFLVFDRYRLMTSTLGSAAQPDAVEGSLAVSGLGYMSSPPFIWSDDSRTIFGVRQKTVKPSGFAIEPLSTIAIPVGGKPPLPLPALPHSAGRLDGLVWVGGGGLALAAFDTKGGYYRPERSNPSPSLAIIDARLGKVQQVMRLPTVKGEASLVQAIDAQVDRHGKIYAIFVLGNGQWFAWHQGSPPEPIAPHLKSGSLAKFAVAPDLKTILVMRNLSASGMICESLGNNRCPPPTPVTGAIAELHDVRSGRVLWTLSGTARELSVPYQPAISRDGRYALIALREGGGGNGRSAVISMSDGHILQQINHVSNWAFGPTFAQDGRSASLSGGSITIVYKVGAA